MQGDTIPVPTTQTHPPHHKPGLNLSAPTLSRDRCSEQITRLTNTFPCLQSFMLKKDEQLFDVEEFMKRFRGASRGEYLCALFIANVWNPEYAKKRKWHFDAIEFLRTVDRHNRQAFLKWAEWPEFP